ncbi:MAG TPA: 1,4-dihydroxy-2-naphthoate octaprenyltransferase, partial [bacterium]|nr:1,4-dihydroxy-2-naphthoate octaprenyltransferase [bacterium]
MRTTTPTRLTGERSTSGVPPVISWWRVWWRAVRPFSFTASMTPVLVGTAVAFASGPVSVWLFAATLVASVAIHAGANLINDYYDHFRGVDGADTIGPSGVIQLGWLSPLAMHTGALVLFACGAVAGAGIVAARGPVILLLGAISVAAGYAYTGGPLPLGYLGLGDLVVIIFMGGVITVGAYFVQTGGISAAALWAALPVAALVDAILVANNLRDLEGDRARGKRTLAVVLGTGATRIHYLALVVSAYAAVAVGVVLRGLPVWALATALTI